MSRVDVVVPCYNYGHYLRGCVESILDQPGVDVRILVIDDCSSDESAEVGRQLAANDTRIEFRRHERNRGHIATYNEGLLEWASGDYCLLISADDLLVPGALSRASAILDSHPEVGLCYGRQIVFSDTPPVVARPAGPTTHAVVTGAAFWRQCCQFGQNVVPTPTAVVRTSIQRVVGGYRAELPHTADLKIWLRIASRSDVTALDADQALKRMHGANMQVRFVSTALEDLRQRLLAFESAFAECRRLLTDASHLEESARKVLALEAIWTANSAFETGDLDGCRTGRELAKRVWPAITASREWSRLSLKMNVGTRLWRLVSPMWHWLGPEKPADPEAATRSQR